MEQRECSETSAFKIQTPANNPEESIRHSKQGESLKSRLKYITISIKCLQEQEINKRLGVFLQISMNNFHRTFSSGIIEHANGIMQ
jgi:hypothetical protein